MTWFLFVGDMLVMLFMCVLVVWVYLKSTSEAADEAARIPLQDEHADDRAADRFLGRMDSRTDAGQPRISGVVRIQHLFFQVGRTTRRPGLG